MQAATLTSGNRHDVYGPFTPCAQKMGFVSAKNRRKKSAAPSPNFRLLVGSAAWDRQRTALHAAPSAPYGNAGYVWVLVGWNCVSRGVRYGWKDKRK